MGDSPRRAIAIDWSGAKKGAGKRIWLAEVSEGRLVRLENGRSREEVVEHLISIACEDLNFVVGFDFAFSLPAWFLEERGLASAPRLWNVAADEAEDWLAAREPPFWGKPGRGRPDLGADRDHYRRTERETPTTKGIRPKSVFQIGGAGAVGTGSLRGMPMLLCLKKRGFSVWPFHPPDRPQVVEIYPRLLTGPVNKSGVTERADYLDERCPALDDALRLKAVCSEDAFDAAASALVMHEHRDELETLMQAEDSNTMMEGEIWRPSGGFQPDDDVTEDGEARA